MLVRFNDYSMLNEGVYDPGIFKAIFLCGGPGSGKSTSAKNLSVGGKVPNRYGLKVINSDDIFEKLLKDFKISSDLEKLEKENPEEYEKAMGLRGVAKQSTHAKQSLSIHGRLGLVLDGTGKDYEELKEKKEKLEEFGYDCFMIFVNTSLDIALQRNAQRDRVVKVDIVKQSWNEVQANLDKFKSLFGSKFLLFNNDSPDKDDIEVAWKFVDKFMNKPIDNPIAKAWIAKEMEKKKNA